MKKLLVIALVLGTLMGIGFGTNSSIVSTQMESVIICKDSDDPLPIQVTDWVNSVATPVEDL